MTEFPWIGMNHGKRYGAIQVEISKQIWLFTRLPLEVRSHNQLWNPNPSLPSQCHTRLESMQIKVELAVTHKFCAFNSILITGEADPRAKDGSTHKENIAQELSWRGQAAQCTSVQVKGHRNGLHGHHHLRASKRHKSKVICYHYRILHSHFMRNHFLIEVTIIS